MSHKRVAWLIVYWSDSSDSSKALVKQFASLLKETLLHSVTIVELKTEDGSGEALEQIRRQIKDLVYSSDSRETLLAFYYMGHGSHKANSSYRLYA